MEDAAGELIDTAQLRALLGELAERLAEQGVEARIFVVGGAALALGYYDEGDRRLTNDVDAWFFPVDVVSRVAQTLADEHGLRPGWLNGRASQFSPPPASLKAPSLSAESRWRYSWDRRGSSWP